MIVNREIKYDFDTLNTTPTTMFEVANEYICYKISDNTLTEEQILESTFISDYGNGEVYERTPQCGDILYQDDGYSVFQFKSKPANAFIVVYKVGELVTNCLGMSISISDIPETGIYMMYNKNVVPSRSLNVTIRYSEEVEEVEEETDIPEVSHAEFIESMGLGYNYGNTYDAYAERSNVTDNSETYNLWGNTKLSKTVIDMLKEEGFKTIRLPVTWFNHLDEDGKIYPSWLSEIKRAVDIILNADMYCILNVHHDTGEKGWLRADISKIDEMSDKLTSLWAQIAKHFKNYDERLIFEGFNEILNSENQWSGVDESCYVATQTLNQVFINTVRAAGGYNAKRWVICNAYACNHDYYTGCDMVGSYLMPNDNINRMLVQFHVYKDLVESIRVLDRIYARFKKENVGVVIGEWGMQASSANITTREAYALGFVKHCKELGFHCCWWDDGGSNSEDPSSVWTFGLIGKGTANVWWYKSIADQMIIAWRGLDEIMDIVGAIYNTIEYVKEEDNILSESDRDIVVTCLIKIHDSLVEKVTI